MEGQSYYGFVHDDDAVLEIWNLLSAVEPGGEPDTELSIEDAGIAFFFTMKDGTEHTVGFETSEFLSTPGGLYSLRDRKPLKSAMLLTVENLQDS